MRTRGKVAAVLALLLPLAAVLIFGTLWLFTPTPLEVAAQLPCGVTLRDAHGRVLRVGLSATGEDCRPITTIATNAWIVQALIAAEDRNFFTHCGIDPSALLRAAWQNVTSLRRVSGASTITMQTVRLMHPPRPRTHRVKATESIQALKLERAMNKPEILLNYLNRAPFGSNLTGIEAGAQGWFGKGITELHLGEAALLAGMVQSPSRLRPDRHLERCLKRRDYVLERMQLLGMIDEQQVADAVKVPIKLSRAPRPFLDPFFCDWAQRSLPPGDHRTTLDPNLQQLAHATLERHAAKHGCDGAVVVLSVSNNAVNAWHCTGDYFSRRAGQVNTVITPRPAGSTLKPFAYALAFDRGLLTPGTILADVPRQFGNQQPLNFSGSFIGPVTVREALIRSLNIPVLESVELCGLERFHATLRQLGFAALNKPPQYYGLGLALGNGSVRLLELAEAYACLARGGTLLPRAADDTPPRPFSAGSCWLIADILGGPERSRDSLGHTADTHVARFAWKTGTSSGFRDAWTVAWSPTWVVAVWCGYKSGTSGGDQLVGKLVAAPTVWDIARHLPDGGWFPKPPAVIERKVCALSGQAPGALCPKLVDDLALRDRTLNKVCTVHTIDSSGNLVTKFSAALSAWLAQHRVGTVPPAAVPLRITSPADGSHYKIIDGVFAQEILFSTNGTEGKGLLAWFCNDAFIGSQPTLRWSPQPGTHRFVCAAANGDSSTITITVEEN